MISPEILQVLITFLLSVGSFALNELGQRWALRRKNESEKVDLNENNSGDKLSKLIEKTLKSDKEAQRIVDLIERRQKLIYDAKRGMLNDGEQYNQGNISLNMLELRKEDHKRQIEERMLEIENDLHSIGLDIEKENV